MKTWEKLHYPSLENVAMECHTVLTKNEGTGAHVHKNVPFLKLADGHTYGCLIVYIPFCRSEHFHNSLLNTKEKI